MFREDKATAAAVCLLQFAEQHELNDLVLMKLLYLAERRCMRETTSLITGDRFISMRNGPVLSETLDLMRGRRDGTFWPTYIGFLQHRGEGTPSNRCVLRQALNVAEYLSAYEQAVLADTWREYGNTASKWSLVNLTHEFPEWDKTCEGTRSATPIELKKVFELGFGDPAEVAEARANEIEYFESLVA